jgi:hypothetical protein
VGRADLGQRHRIALLISIRNCTLASPNALYSALYEVLPGLTLLEQQPWQLRSLLMHPLFWGVADAMFLIFNDSMIK